jgi:hypothetical protein
MFLWHVGQRGEQHIGREPPHRGWPFGDGGQVPLTACQNLGNAKHLVATELASDSMAIKVEYLDDAGLDEKEMRCHLVWSKQGLTMEKRYAGGVAHGQSARQTPLHHLGGN